MSATNGKPVSPLSPVVITLINCVQQRLHIRAPLSSPYVTNLRKQR